MRPSAFWRAERSQEMNEEYLERESDMPIGWNSNVIFERDCKGNVIELAIPDDEEVTDIVGND